MEPTTPGFDLAGGGVLVETVISELAFSNNG